MEPDSQTVHQWSQPSGAYSRRPTGSIPRRFLSRQDEATGDVILSRRPADWAGFFEMIKQADIPADFLRPARTRSIRTGPRSFAGCGRMKRYMLDTNTVSHLLKGHPLVIRRVTAVSMASLCISAVTEGELRYRTGKATGCAAIASCGWRVVAACGGASLGIVLSPLTTASCVPIWSSAARPWRRWICKLPPMRWAQDSCW